MSSKPLVPEDEFANRDASGLQPEKEDAATEASEMKKYSIMLLLVVPLLGQVFAWSTYFAVTKLSPTQKDVLDKKFAFIQEHDLGYVFLAVWISTLARGMLVVNANAARAGARVDRPDQHVYKIMAASGPLKDAPYVLMAGTGPQGRFNRAHRGMFNTDEALPLYLASLLLVGPVFGPVVPCLALLWGVGRITFGFKYKESSKARGAGFLPAVIAEGWLGGLVLLCAIKGLFNV